MLEIYRDALERRSIEPGRVEKFVYVDIDGRYYRRGLGLRSMFTSTTTRST